MTFENICFQKHNRLFEFRQFQLIFRSIYSSVSVNTGHNPFPVNYNLISITVLALNIFFLGFVTAVTTRFHKIFEIFLYVYIL